MFYKPNAPHSEKAMWIPVTTEEYWSIMNAIKSLECRMSYPELTGSLVDYCVVFGNPGVANGNGLRICDLLAFDDDTLKTLGINGLNQLNLTKMRRKLQSLYGASTVPTPEGNLDQMPFFTKSGLDVVSVDLLASPLYASGNMVDPADYITRLTEDNYKPFLAGDLAFVITQSLCNLGYRHFLHSYSKGMFWARFKPSSNPKEERDNLLALAAMRSDLDVIGATKLDMLQVTVPRFLSAPFAEGKVDTPANQEQVQSNEHRHA